MARINQWLHQDQYQEKDKDVEKDDGAIAA